MRFVSKSSCLFFFPDLDRLILIFIWKCKGPNIVKTVLKIRTKLEDFILPV